MYLRNTSRYPDSEVRALVDFARKGFNDKRVCINVKNSRSDYAGTAYPRIPSVSNAPKSARYLITIRIGKPDKFPSKNWGSYHYKTVGKFDFRSWQEAMIAVVAHELTHIRQYRYNKKRSEVECIRGEYKKLIEWRNLA